MAQAYGADFQKRLTNVKADDIEYICIINENKSCRFHKYCLCFFVCLCQNLRSKSGKRLETLTILKPT